MSKVFIRALEAITTCIEHANTSNWLTGNQKTITCITVWLLQWLLLPSPKNKSVIYNFWVIRASFRRKCLQVKKRNKSPRPGCCYMVCAVAHCKHMQKSPVSLSCLQAGLWLPSPWKACGGCSWGDTTITRSVHIQSTAFSHPQLLMHIRPSVEEGGGDLSLNCLSWGFFCFFLLLTI